MAVIMDVRSLLGVEAFILYQAVLGEVIDGRGVIVLDNSDDWNKL